MIITLDAMGGDNAPAAAVHGAVWAARDFGVTIQLVGQPDVIEAELAKHNTTGLDLPIIPASEVIEMDESPAKAVKSKKNLSLIAQCCSRRCQNEGRIRPIQRTFGGNNG